MNERVVKVFSEIFKIPSQKVHEGMSSQTIESWDSFTHLKLILAVEKEFNVQFETEVIPTLNSVKALIKGLQEKAAL